MSAAHRILAPSCSNRRPGSNFQIIPYRGTPDIIVALLRNDVQLMVDFYASDEAHAVREENPARSPRPGPQRSPFFTDVPTVAQAGVAGYEVTSWNGIFAPHRQRRPEIINTLNKAMHEILAIPEVKQRYPDLGIEAKASSPAELKARLKATSRNGRR